MRTCTSCFNILPTAEFDFQKQHPDRRYRWCNGCRAAAVPYVPKQGYRQFETMLEHGRRMRKLSEHQIHEIRAHRKNGITGKVLAEQYKVSPSVIYKVASPDFKI